MIRSADAILLAYVESRSRLASAAAIGFTVHAGRVTTLFCEATRKCSGTPRRNRDGQWHCSACNKPWHFELVELGRTQIGGRVRIWGKERRLARDRRSPREPETRSHRDLREYGPVLRQVHDENLHAAFAWRLHVLDPRGIEEKRATALGEALERIPARMAELIEGRFLPEVLHDLTIYRVRTWIGWARRRTLEIHEERIARTVAAAAREQRR